MKRQTMQLYSNKRKLKIILLLVAIILVGVSLLISNRIVRKVAQVERERVTQWADAIKKRAELIKLTNLSFDELRNKELAEMELWIDATKEISRNTDLNNTQSYDLPLKILNRNKDIPVIVIDQDNQVSTYINLGFQLNDFYALHPEKEKQEVKTLFTDSLLKLAHSWDNINPSFTIEVYDNMFMSFYYNDSRQITRLEHERDSVLQAFNKELIENPELVPVVLTDSAHTKIIASNLLTAESDSIEIAENLRNLALKNKPIAIEISESETYYLFYANSPELIQLQYFPYIQFTIISLFILIGYIIFSTFRKAEQNKVWAGMAKETAHQLGTPISSLMAWVQLLEAKEESKDIALEMEKDINRLTQVTNRFSKIGVHAELVDGDIVETTREFLAYFSTRAPKKVELSFETNKPQITVPHHPELYGWVIENIYKNAIDAMEGEGKIEINITDEEDKVHIDISDTGKGMTAAQQRNVFQPGFTTKKRGWGLGLSLVKRIIQENHKGRIRILHSEPQKGTCFRITLWR